MPTTTLYLVRHGEAENNDATDPALTAAGLVQARSTGNALRATGADLVIHGTRRRSIESARAIATALDTASTQSSDLFEDRTPIPEDWSDVPVRYHASLRDVPSAEADHGARRLTQAVEHFSRPGPDDRTIVAVTHTFVFGWFVRSALDAPWWRWIGLNTANGAITAIRWSSDRESRLLSFNERGHLADS